LLDLNVQRFHFKELPEFIDVNQSCLLLCNCHIVTFSFVKRLFSKIVVSILRVPLVAVMLLVAVYKERMLLACVDT